MYKIAHVQVMPKLSGVQNFSLNVLKSLDGCEKYLICSSSEFVSDQQREFFEKSFLDNDIKIIWMKHLKRSIGVHDLYACRELWELFKEYKFDIVHTNSTKPGILARVVAKVAGIRTVVHTVHGVSFHAQEKKIKRFFYFLLEAIALQFGNYNISVNKYYLKYYKFFFWKKSICIYNGADFSRMTTNLMKDLPPVMNKGVKNVLFVGRLDIPKNPLVAIKAFSLLIRRGFNVKFHIVGDGELRDVCEKLVKYLNIEDHVIFHGWVDTPYSFYSECDVFFSPSIYEAFGFTFTEAAYFSKPIVSSTVEGIPEIVKDKKMGFLCNPKNHVSMADSLQKIISDNTLSKEMGEYGKEYVLSNFNLTICLEKYKEVYIELMKK
ncbi:glycosyltransferase family 4 protein [Pectobacterium aroidearum]|uniref:glycosyltransferase family 4 protein n=1 Tax=Pectobacterium aroidearum TaxID=1201031 RepID=UPI00301A53DE